MKKQLLVILIFSFSLGIAQTFKSKYIKIRVPSYPEKGSVKSLSTISGGIVEKETRALPFTEEEFKNALVFEDKEYSPNADMTFAVKGVSVNGIDISVTKENDNYLVAVIPNAKARIEILLMLKNGQAVHYDFFRVSPRRDINNNPIRETVIIPYSSYKKYFEFGDEDKFWIKPALVEKYLNKRFKEGFLNTDLIPSLLKKYDYGSKVVNNSIFYYVKDKKNNKALKQESKNKITAFQDLLAKTKTLKDLRANKPELEKYAAYWNNLYEKYKDEKKVAWAMLVNLHKLSIIMEDKDKAKKYFDAIVALNTKKAYTSLIKKEYENYINSYSFNHDASGERSYLENFEVDNTLKKVIALDKKRENVNNEKAKEKSHDLKEVIGEVILENGDKLKGRITLLFSESPNQTKDAITLTGGSTAGKLVILDYKNKKGKSKRKKFKYKKVKEVIANNKLYKPVRLESSSLGALVGLMSLSSNNTVLAEEIYFSDKVGIYRDNRNNKFYVKFPKDKKAKNINPKNNFITTISSIFSSCSELDKRINNNEFKENETDLIKMAKFYTESCQ